MESPHKPYKTNVCVCGVFYTCLCFDIFLQTSNFLYHRQSSDIESNEVLGASQQKVIY